MLTSLRASAAKIEAEIAARAAKRTRRHSAGA
jgi:hypothetical protein